jgi:hypothetical protein
MSPPLGREISKARTFNAVALSHGQPRDFCEFIDLHPRHDPQHFPRPSICFSFVFKILQIPFPATPVFSHLYKTLGWCTFRYRRSRFTPHDSPGTNHKSRLFIFLRTLFPSLRCFSQPASLFSIICALFCKIPGGGVCGTATLGCPSTISPRNQQSARSPFAPHPRSLYPRASLT